MIDMLIGSSRQVSNPSVGGRRVTLGEVVREAVRLARMSVEEWNSLEQHLREDRIEDALAIMRSHAAMFIKQE